MDYSLLTVFSYQLFKVDFIHCFFRSSASIESQRIQFDEIQSGEFDHFTQVDFWLVFTDVLCGLSPSNFFGEIIEETSTFHQFFLRP